jgi:hypothetical protein
MTLVFERAKTFRALDRAATVIGKFLNAFSHSYGNILGVKEVEIHLLSALCCRSLLRVTVLQMFPIKILILKLFCFRDAYLEYVYVNRLSKTVI